MSTKSNSPMGNMAPSATLAIDSKAKALCASGEDVCAMSAGEPDFGTFKVIVESAIKALNDGKTKYTPVSGIPELKKACAEKLVRENGIASNPEQVVIAPGAKFSCFSAIAALCGPGDEVIIPSPYWLSYPEMVRGIGAVPVYINTKPEDNYELNPAQLAAAITPKTKLLILNSPSNPTGAVYRRETLEAIADIIVERDIMVMSDEIYEKLVYDAELPHVSIGSLSPEINERTITINGFSKSYAMTGWRLGYLSAPLWLAKRITSLQSHTTSNPTTFAQYAAITALKECNDEIETMRQRFVKRRDLICDMAKKVPGIKAIRPAGAFYLFFDIAEFGMGANAFCEKFLEEYKVAGIPGEAFGAPTCVRFSYACAEETIIKAMDRLAKFCASLK